MNRRRNQNDAFADLPELSSPTALGWGLCVRLFRTKCGLVWGILYLHDRCLFRKLGLPSKSQPTTEPSISHKEFVHDQGKSDAEAECKNRLDHWASFREHEFHVRMGHGQDRVMNEVNPKRRGGQVFHCVWNPTNPPHRCSNDSQRDKPSGRRRRDRQEYAGVCDIRSTGGPFAQVNSPHSHGSYQ